MNKDDMIILNELADIIRKNGSISKTELWKKTSLSIWQFDKIKQYLPELFDDIEFNRKKKAFVAQKSLSLFFSEDMK